MSNGRSIVWVLALALALAACHQKRKYAEVPYDNPKGLASTLDKPATGGSEDRAYRNSRYRDQELLAPVTVLEPEVREQTLDDPEYQSFLQGLRSTLVDVTAGALAESRRFAGVQVAGQGTPRPTRDLVCTVEALPHVNLLGHPVQRDPVFRDTRPKIVLLFTVADAASGDVVYRYTAWRTSEWEYGSWAMEDLRTLTLALAREFEVIISGEE